MSRPRRPKQAPKPTDLLDSAHAIWLAGLGSLAIAEQEGTKLFRELVARGRELEGRLAEPVEATRSSLAETVREVRARAGTAAKSFESALDEQVKRVLGSLGLPTRAEISELSQRVESLQRKLGASGGTARRRTKTRKNKKSG